MKFSIPVVYESWGRVTVDAKDERDLAKKLSSKDFINDMLLPSGPEYVEDSYRIDTDGINGSASVIDDGNKDPPLIWLMKNLKQSTSPRGINLTKPVNLT